jgi:hypothetical protein
MTDEEKHGDLIERKEGQVPAKTSENSIVLGDSNVLQTTGLTDTQIQELRMQHASGMIDIHKKAQELQIDVKALDATLDTMATQTEQVSKAGDSVTMTHSHDSSLGRTEVMMGNTKKAAAGKLSRSQTGEDDNTMKYVIIIAVVGIVVAIIAAN